MIKAFIDIGGEAYIEDLKPRFHMVDEVDGFHVLTKDAIFRPANHKDPHLTLFWGGRQTPLSFVPLDAAASLDVSDSDLFKVHHSRLPVSKRWPRLFAWVFKWLLRWGYFIFGSFMLGLGVYILVVLGVHFL